MADETQRVSFEYTNYRGETSERTVLPGRIYFGTTDWHKQPQWLLEAYDVEKQAHRTFAMGDVRGWHPASDEALGPVTPR